ncbi:hypothetical protein Y032_0705g1683 [Ancylostoma ceylanicum]|uniref:Uncharacterized protein n=1 Tax=Ancylostoma ceylanicum TaxID=53326 RepID=A0A016WI07_9BILA|nr:hypothetical protein Y032_0705g1683 [Ancylostoma ceylanicum]
MNKDKEEARTPPSYAKNITNTHDDERTATHLARSTTQCATDAVNGRGAPRQGVATWRAALRGGTRAEPGTHARVSNPVSHSLGTYFEAQGRGARPRFWNGLRAAGVIALVFIEQSKTIFLLN